MRRAVTVGLAAAAALTGCGGGGGDGADDAPAVTVPAGKPLAVKAEEYRFEPSSIVLESGSQGATDVTVELRNDGAIAHDLRIRDGAKDVGGTAIFGPGRTEEGKATLEPGEYEIFCSVGNHEDLGMKGKLVVR